MLSRLRADPVQVVDVANLLDHFIDCVNGLVSPEPSGGQLKLYVVEEEPWLDLSRQHQQEVRTAGECRKEHSDELGDS